MWRWEYTFCVHIILLITHNFYENYLVGQNHQIGSLLQINYQNGSVSFLFTKGVCYFTTKRLSEGHVSPERDTWRDLTGRWDRGGSGGLPGATTSGGLPGATSSGGAPGATTSGSLSGTSTSGGPSHVPLPYKTPSPPFHFHTKNINKIMHLQNIIIIIINKININ